jgi:hypothetical protein
MGGFMKYAVEMASCNMMYIPSLIKIGIGVQTLLGRGIYRHARAPDNTVNSEAYFYSLRIRKVG